MNTFKRAFLLCAFVCALAVSGFAQSASDITVSGTLFNSFNDPCTSCTFTVTVTRRDGVAVQATPRTVTANATTGVVSFTLPRKSFVTFTGNYTVGRYSWRSGISLFIPDQSTVDIVDLQSVEDASAALVAVAAAPSDAQYIVGTANGTLSAEQSLGAFTFESKQVSMFDSLTEIGGVQVWIGGKERGQLAQLRYVGYDTISFVMPSASSLQQLGWQQVEVSAPLGQYSALVFIAPVSAEIFTNHCIDSPSCINRMPFGLAWVNNSIVIPTLNEPIPNNNTQVSLFGTGLRRSARILVWITDELDGLAEPVDIEFTPASSGCFGGTVRVF